MVDDDHDRDPDSAVMAAIDGASPCPCCSSPCVVATWLRSMKRKLEGEKRGRDGDEDGPMGMGRVEAEDETAALRDCRRLWGRRRTLWQRCRVRRRRSASPRPAPTARPWI
jgi:hypothetical protein